MIGNELTKNLKTAFEYKNNGNYKQAINYFYKALAFDNESTEIMLELAQLYSKLCKYDRSISFYEQILQRTPDDNNIKYKLAHLLKKNKDYKRAEQILLALYEVEFKLEETAPELFFLLMYHNKYRKIITSYNKYSKKLKNSRVLYFVALAHSELGNKNTADEFFKKSFNNDENNILAGIEIANRLLKKGQSQEAKELALRLLKYTENAGIYYLLAEIESSKGNIDSSIKYYSYAIKINPQNADYYFKLALAFSMKGFFKEAEESYCKAINIDNYNELYNYSLAYMYYIIGKYDLSEKITEMIISRHPDNIKAIALKLLVMMENNKNQYCGKLIEKLEQSEIKDDFALYAQAMYYSSLGLWEKAALAISKALKINKKSVEYNYQLAKFKYESDKNEESALICERIIAKNPKYILAYLLLSKIDYRNKNYDKAVTLLKKILELDKNEFEAYEIWGDIYRNKEQYREAIEKYKIAAAINPNNEQYYAKIGECYFKIEQYKESYLYYKEAAEFNITEAKYRYYMAKCSEKLGNIEDALSNYSYTKRLAPRKIEYIEEYYIYLCSIGKKREAAKLLKIIKADKDIKDLKSLINKL